MGLLEWQPGQALVRASLARSQNKQLCLSFVKGQPALASLSTLGLGDFSNDNFDEESPSVKVIL